MTDRNQFHSIMHFNHWHIVEYSIILGVVPWPLCLGPPFVINLLIWNIF